MTPNKPTTFIGLRACLAIKGWILGKRKVTCVHVPEGYSCDHMGYLRWCYELGLTPGEWDRNMVYA